MTYKTLVRSLEQVMQKATNRCESDTKEVASKIILYIDPVVNDWNRAALELSEENKKIPSRRQRILCFPVVAVRDATRSPRWSTNDWNDLALELIDKHRAKK